MGGCVASGAGSFGAHIRYPKYRARSLLLAGLGLTACGMVVWGCGFDAVNSPVVCLAKVSGHLFFGATSPASTGDEAKALSGTFPFVYSF